MLQLTAVHHIAIICSDYELSKRFYTKVLGFTVLGEYYREERQSYKLDLALKGQYLIELFSFPDPPKRTSRPEAAEPVRVDQHTGRRFTFFADPDDLPLELYEVE